MKKHHLPAFTIMELTVTMLISAIVIGITYSAYSIIMRSYSSFNVKNKDLAMVEQLDKLLRKDFQEADLITKSQNGVICKGKTFTVNYQFDPAFIIRTSDLIDTFKFASDSLTTSFEGQPLNEVSLTEEQNRIDELEIDLELKNEHIPYHYFKQYSSEQLFNRESNAVN